MKTYYLIITLFAVVGVSLVFSDYPLIIGISSFGLAMGYNQELGILKDKEEVKEEVKESNMPGHRNPPPPPEDN